MPCPLTRNQTESAGNRHCWSSPVCSVIQQTAYFSGLQQGQVGTLVALCFLEEEDFSFSKTQLGNSTFLVSGRTLPKPSLGRRESGTSPLQKGRRLTWSLCWRPAAPRKRTQAPLVCPEGRLLGQRGQRWKEAGRRWFSRRDPRPRGQSRA